MLYRYTALPLGFSSPCACFYTQMATSSRYCNEKLSVAYAKFRPVYSQQVTKIINSYITGANGGAVFDMALDVGCGSGQSTFLVCDSYKKVVGVDVSSTQIKQAKKQIKTEQAKSARANVEFLVADAQNLPFESSSVDLLTCAMTWHWLDTEKFYAEAKRILKPHGCIAVYGHGVRVADNARIRKAFDIFNGELFQFNCFPEQNLHVLNNYKSVELPFMHTERIDFDLPQQVTIDQLLGFFSSVSMYESYCEKYPNNTLLQKIKYDYEAQNGKCDVETFTFPGFVIMGLND